MGLDPTFPDFEEGEVCPRCVELLFDGITPKYVEAHVSDIEACIFPGLVPPDGVYRVKQTVIPCEWRSTIGVYHFLWQFIENRSLFLIFEFYLGVPWTWFRGQSVVECLDQFVNQQPCLAFRTLGEHGTVEVFWGPVIGT